MLNYAAKTQPQKFSLLARCSLFIPLLQPFVLLVFAHFSRRFFHEELWINIALVGCIFLPTAIAICCGALAMFNILKKPTHWLMPKRTFAMAALGFSLGILWITLVLVSTPRFH